MEYEKPEELSSSKVYDELARTAVSEDPRALRYVYPEYVNNYHELLKIVLDDENIEYSLLNRSFPFYGVLMLEETKRRDLLNYIKSFQCNLIDRNILRNCKYNQEETAEVDKWLEDYYSYEKKQEAN